MAESSGVLLPKPTEIFVGPLAGIGKIDVGAGIKACDGWLRGISDGFITIERLKMVANALPVVANIMSAVDLVLDIKDMIEHHQQGHNPDLFDWMNLTLDLIGIIPMPPDMAEFRMGGRPVMKMIREELVKAGKTVAEASWQVIEGAVMQAVIDSLSEQFAGKIQSFVDGMKKGLDTMLKHCAEYIEKFMLGFADLFAEVAGDKALSVEGNLSAAGKHADQAAAGFASHDARKTINGIGNFIVDFWKVEVKEAVNLGTAVAKKLDLPYQKLLREMADTLRKMVPVVKQRILEMGGADFGKIGFLINFFQTVLDKKHAALEHMRLHGSGVKAHGTTKVHREEGEGRKETVRHTAEAEHPGANDCKTRCPVPSPAGASGHSVGFALGDERLNHHDFVLPGAMPINWTRTYRSFFDANDESGELGARWITPYTTRIDIHAAKLVYHDGTGRSVEYPLLAAGDAHDDQGEGLTLLRLDEQWLTLTRGPELLEAYEKRGSAFRLAFVKDRAGNQVTLDYDQQHHLHRLITPHAIVAFTHDGRGRIVEAVHHDGEGKRVATLARYTYGSDGDLVVATDRYGNRREYAYRHHLITRYTDRTGRAMNLEWNGTGPKAKCIHEYADDGSDEIRLAWHPDFRLVSLTDGLGNVTKHYYDLHGYTFRIVHPGGREEWMYRDANHNLIQHTYPDGSSERMTYDARSNLIRHARRDGSVVEMAYDGKDQMVSMTDPHGYVWKLEYDSAGNITTRIDPLGRKTEYSYNDQGLVTKIKDAKGGTSAIAYDDAGQVIAQTDCSGKTTTWAYDSDGRLLKSGDPAGGSTVFSYGTNGRPIEVRTPAGLERIAYDAEGRLLSHIDSLNRTTRFDYNAAGRIGRRVDALGQTTSYRYDQLGRMVTLVDANSATYSFQYDSLGKLIQESGFDGRTTRYTYGGSDGRLQSIDEAGQSVTVEYDCGGRPTGRVAGDETERFSYDAGGRWIEAQNRYSRLQRFFDPVGNLVREHHAYSLFGESRSYVWHHEYDELGNRIKTIRPDGHTIDWLTYGSGHVHGMLLDGEERVQFERDDLYRETLRTLPSRIRERTTYDQSGWLTRRTVQREKAPAPFLARNYRYDAAGQAIEIEDSSKGLIAHRYDVIGRLIETNGPLGRERFAFDPASNILDARRPESTLPLDVPRALGNLLTQYAGTRFEYDASGNLSHSRSSHGEQHYEWDAFHRLRVARVSRPERRFEARYYYDALGRRIAKEVNGERTVFGWDGDRLAYETNASSSAHYIYEVGSFVPLAQFVTAAVEGIPTPVAGETDRYMPEDDPLQRIPQRSTSARLFHYHCDPTGTPLSMTDEAGEVVWDATYRAWGEAGEVIARVSKVAGITPCNPLRFQGQQFDEETGLHYNRFRYYDPQHGRFVSQDPIGLWGGANLYQYAPNPIGYIDPLGLAKGKCTIYWYNNIGGRTGHYTVKTMAGTGNMHTEQQNTGDTTWIARVNSADAGEPANSATFDVPDVGAAQTFQRDKVRAGDRQESNGAYNVMSNSCMTHVMDVLNAGGVEAPSGGRAAWDFLNNAGVGPRAK
ncbi:sugar-binding protein [Paraburkholderia acidicola]|uniref:Sugar-binding protein n=1 Tax=Paraburkholderia acidicola TaxID=1912599 RepID=A0A2A4F064_9BURK|nr:RHS repeat-associated core domain-containing protein [Paraburkholderia acidicola]PCE26092.1 sugar-binding protein [Paraburkholderia acidicola]